MEELRNLKLIYSIAAERFSQYEGKDFVLPKVFKEQVKEINNNTITYNKYSAVIETRGNQNGVLNIFLPNQWFYIASYFTDFYNELQRYKKEALKVVSKDRLKELNGVELTDEEMKRLIKLSLNDTSKAYLKKFMTDYSWWGGAKTIDRGDFYVSPILSSARLVNASQSFVADLCAFLADKKDLVNTIINGEETNHSPFSKVIQQETSISSFAYDVFRFLERKDKLKAFEKLVVLSKANNYDGEPLTHLQSKESDVRLINVFIEKESKPSQTYYYTEPFDFNGKNVYLNNGWASDDANRPDLTLHKLAIIVNECYGPEVKVLKSNGHYELHLYKIVQYNKLQSHLTAIRTKPFLLLAGISGTGKSRIVRELAFMTCPKRLQDEDGTTPGNYCMIEVKPNWHDSTELLGYYSSFNGGGYRFTKFDKFIVKAWLNPDVPFFVCLDEMNLAPVEQYFAEFLSVLETRSRDKDENVVTGAIVDKQYFVKDDTNMENELGLYNQDENAIKVHLDILSKGLTLPPNLIVIGTVNMDDTTYQFSRKVIDRAMTIEMNGGELSEMYENSNNLKYRNDDDVVKLDWFMAPYINADEVIERYQGQADIIKKELPKRLDAINEALKDTPFQVSYRVLNELVIYLGALMDEATAKGKPIDDEGMPALIDKAVDQITLMKILPRIEGDEDIFRRQDGNVLSKMQGLFLQDTDSFKKLQEMTERLNRTGFTRFWP